MTIRVTVTPTTQWAEIKTFLFWHYFDFNDALIYAEKYPTIKFTSSSITKTATGYAAVGTLDMHGVQKPVTIPFTFDNNEFKASFEVNRMDYNVNTAEPNHGGQKFKVDIDVPVTK